VLRARRRPIGVGDASRADNYAMAPCLARFPFARARSLRTDREAGNLLHRLSLLAEDLPEVTELDFNPVIALPNGCVAVHARVRLVVRKPRAALKSW
jgi:hypothetical protein